MLQAKLGGEDVAKDWYAAARVWMTDKQLDWEPLLQMNREAAAAVGLAIDWSPADWKHAHYVDLYSRLLEKQPTLAQLYHSRGSHFGAMGDWQKAVADYGKAVEISKDVMRHWEAHAAASLQLGDVVAYETDCRMAYARIKEANSPTAMMDCVLLSSLRVPLPIDAGELLQVVEEVGSNASLDDKRPFTSLCHAMALYRCGRHEEALENLPASGLSSPKDEVLSLAFRAMAHHQLGDAYSSRKVLEQARSAFETQLCPLDGPELPVEDRAVAWAMAKLALQEAETLVPVRISPENQPSSSLGD